MRLEDTRSKVEWAVHACKHIFWPTSEEDLDYGTGEPVARRGSRRHSRELRGGEEEEEEDDNEQDTVPAGQRAERWFERIEHNVKQNRKKSRQNFNRLERMDFRTVWIARLLLAVFGTVLGGVVLQLVIMP